MNGMNMLWVIIDLWSKKLKALWFWSKSGIFWNIIAISSSQKRIFSKAGINIYKRICILDEDKTDNIIFLNFT